MPEVRIDLTDWRERVKEIRGLAEYMRNPRAIEIIRRIAADYEERARGAEQSRARHSGKPRRLR
jgi:hypothetical protein